MKKIFILILICISCATRPPVGKVRIIKQWHLAPKQNTKDIRASTSLPQYPNQLWIYRYLREQNGLILLAEGCGYPQELTDNFNKTFNAWNMQELKSFSHSERFGDVLTYLPMKLKAEMGQRIKIFCADDESVMEQSLRALSDARGYFGFYSRFRQFQEKNEPEKFERYRQELQRAEQDVISDPLEYAKLKGGHALQAFMQFSNQRNERFVATIAEHLEENPVLIVGGLHLVGLEELLKKKKIAYEIITPEGYPEQDESKIVQEMKIINSL